jgi:hypothetical protein
MLRGYRWQKYVVVLWGMSSGGLNIARVDAIISLSSSRIKQIQQRKIDCTSPEKEYQQLLFPVSAVFNYPQWREGFQQSWNYAADKVALARQFELEVIKKFEHYQLPVIQLRPELSKLAVCQVFEDMHELPTRMTFFDLTTACFAAADFSLRADYAEVYQHLSRFEVLKGVRNTDWLSTVTLVATYRRREVVMTENPRLHPLPTIGCDRRHILDLELEDYRASAPITLTGSVYLRRLVEEQGIGRGRLEEILRSHYIEPQYERIEKSLKTLGEEHQIRQRIERLQDRVERLERPISRSV